MDDQLRSRSEHGRSLPCAAVHAAQLNRIHLQDGILRQYNIRHRIYPFCTLSVTCSNMFFLIQDMSAFFKKKRCIPLWRASSSPSEWTPHPCHNRHIGAGSHIEIIVYKIINVPMSHTGGNVHGLLLCISINPDHKPRCIFLVLDPDMFRKTGGRHTVRLPEY